MTTKPRLTDVTLVLLRVFIGLAISTHGYQKIFGGGMAGFTEGVAGMGFPAPEIFAWLAALSEFGGGILLALGLFSRLGALAVMGVMGTAFFVYHAADPFSVKEMAFAYLVVSSSLLFSGGGYYSLDHIITARIRRKRRIARAQAEHQLRTPRRQNNRDADRKSA